MPTEAKIFGLLLALEWETSKYKWDSNMFVIERKYQFISYFLFVKLGYVKTFNENGLFWLIKKQ